MTPGRSENMEDERRSFMERLLFRKVELWLVGLLVTVMLGLTVLFGAVVRNQLLGHDKFGAAGVVALKVAEIPSTIRKMRRQKLRLHAVQMGKRFAGHSGWEFPNPSRVAGLDGYLLLSRVDGDISRQIVELVDLSDFEILHRWEPDAESLFAGLETCLHCVDDLANWTFRTIHPLAFENGDILVKNHGSPLARIDACGKPVWINPDMFHHATELDENGDIWSRGYIWGPGRERPADRGKDYYNDTIIHATADGRTVAQYDVTDILMQNGYGYLLVGMNAVYHKDPLHPNDVEPVLSDGTYWKTGDVFVSLRNKSTVFLFRPSTGKILWLKTGPWAVQHDVDILGDGRIAIFDNGFNPDVMKRPPDVANQVMVYDFATQTVTSPYKDTLARLEIRTATEGLKDFIPGGYLMVEETNFGRLAIIGPDGELAAQYVNSSSDGTNYLLNWSRYVPKVLGDKIASAVASAACRG